LEVAARIVAWGDWRHAIQAENSFDVVGEDERVTTYDGRLLDTGRSGALVSQSDGFGYVPPGTTEVREVSGVDSAFAAQFSDDGERLALLVSEGVMVVSVRDGSVARMTRHGEPGVPQVIWSSDGRLIVYPGRSRLRAVDTGGEPSFELLTARGVAGVGAVPPDRQ